MLGGVNSPLTNDISDFNVVFSDDKDISSYNDVDEILDEINTGSQCSKLFSKVKKCLTYLSSNISNILESFTSMNNKLYVNLQGSEYVFSEISSSSMAYIDITFSDSMPNTNYIICTQICDGGTYWWDLSINVTKRTTTGFRIEVYNNNASNKTNPFRLLWVACAHRLV